MTQTCNQENMRMWIQALRSGGYKQGRGNLKVITPQTGSASYCCLGVACEVAMGNGVQMALDFYPVENSCPSWPAYVHGLDSGCTSKHGVRFAGTGSSLPNRVQEWLGIDSDDPEICGVSTISANDSFGWDFNQIADALEKTYGLSPQEAGR